VAVEAELEGLFAEVRIDQTYENAEASPIEAVFTFPLPLEAVLLGLTVALGDKHLTGAIVPKPQAERDYEQAIVAGDAAIRLEQLEPGLYAMNLGNLLPGEKAVIGIRYGQLLRWRGEAVRFHLPTTLAPRYGVAPFADHVVPRVDATIEYRFGLELRIRGVLAAGTLDSPTHRIAYRPTEDGVALSLGAGTAFPDRDFVLNIEVAEGSRNTALVARDGEQWLVMLSWRPDFGQAAQAPARAVKIVIDCSGSMRGDSMAQARQALAEILDCLRPQDRFDIVRFGTHHKALFGRLTLADSQALEQARSLLGGLAADLGGTEIGQALQAAYRIRGETGEQADVLLITDGEIHDVEPVVAAAGASRHRIFTVGVGAAVSEAFLRRLAEATGGACELVTPNEEMAGRIVRHFKRIGLPRASSVRIGWPGAPLRQVPQRFPAVFDGDTVHAFAWLDQSPAGSINVLAELDKGTTYVTEIPLFAGGPGTTLATDALPRIAGAAWIAEQPDKAEELGLRYRLVTAATDCIVIHARSAEEKTGELPALRSVPHMLAAGWGGTGTVNARSARVALAQPSPPAMSGIAYDASSDIASEFALLAMDSNEEPDWLIWIERFGELIRWDAYAKRLSVSTVAELRSCGIPGDIAEKLERIARETGDEYLVVLTYCHELLTLDVAPLLGREATRAIKKAWRALRKPPQQLVALRNAIRTGVLESP